MARLLVLVAVGLVLMFCFKFVFIPIRITGASMLPTYHEGRLNFINRLSYHRKPPVRGDVVGIRGTTPPHPTFVYLKRIVGLPGERVRIDRGFVFIDGQPLAEPYVSQRSAWATPETILSKEEYFVIGDNRAMDASRHLFGRVEKTDILGKVSK